MNHLFQWLDEDRDRRSLTIHADHYECWRVDLLIDHHIISSKSGNDLEEVLGRVMLGMVLGVGLEEIA
jgi:hypothetical protein